ncbi:MAG: acetyl-coenzyme A synthetase N-terminal domain-containing protein, partial [Myxococcota bacterium]
MDGTASLDVLSDPALGARGQTIAALLADETLSTPQRWQQIAAQLRPADPFSIHQALFQAVYADWDADQGPPPAWIPDGQTPTPQITALLGDRSFAEGHRWSVEEPEAYWSAILTALQIHFNTPPSSILSVEDGVEQARWLPGARLNIAERIDDGGVLKWICSAVRIADQYASGSSTDHRC